MYSTNPATGNGLAILPFRQLFLRLFNFEYTHAIGFMTESLDRSDENFSLNVSKAMFR